MLTVYYRAHPRDKEFSAANAWSDLWGTPAPGTPSEKNPQRRRRGFSCYLTPERLLQYFEHGPNEPLMPDGEPVVIFCGHKCGEGPEGEPLVVPAGHPRPRWTTFGLLRATVKARYATKDSRYQRQERNARKEGAR